MPKTKAAVGGAEPENEKPVASLPEFELAAGPSVPELDRASLQFYAWLFNTTQSRIVSLGISLFVANIDPEILAELDKRLDHFFGTLVRGTIAEHMQDQLRTGRALKRRGNGKLKAVD